MKSKIIMIAGGAIALVLLVGGSVAGTLYLTGMLDKTPAAGAALPEQVAPAPEPVFYHNLQPEFVVNFPGASRVKFLMIEMVVATRDEEVPSILDEHDPEIRNTLLMLLAEQDSNALKTALGKETLRETALAKIEEVVSRHYRPEKIDDVFITRLVMQ